MVETLVGKDAKLEFNPRHLADVMPTWADISRAKEFMNWRPQTPFEEGVRKLVSWYNENRAWAKDIQT